MTLFKEYLALAIAQDRKTQTRRLMEYDSNIAYGDAIVYDHSQDMYFYPERIPTVTKTANSGYWNMPAELYRNGRLKFAVGRDYAVQTKRGGKGLWYVPDAPHTSIVNPDDNVPSLHEIYKPLRFRVTHIGAEDVRNISLNDAKAEGFVNCLDFLFTWVELNDTKFYRTIGTAETLIDRENTIDNNYDQLLGRPAELYRAWIIEFEVVK